MRVGRFLVAGVAVLALAGCSGDKTVSASSLVGGTMGQAYQAIGYDPGRELPPGTLGVVTYNLTSTVTNRPGSGAPGDDWVIVAACFKDEQLPGNGQSFARVALGAVPPGIGTDAVRNEARAGKYNSGLTECPGTSDTFTVTTS